MLLDLLGKKSMSLYTAIFVNDLAIEIKNLGLGITVGDRGTSISPPAISPPSISPPKYFRHQFRPQQFCLHYKVGHFAPKIYFFLTYKTCTQLLFQCKVVKLN